MPSRDKDIKYPEKKVDSSWKDQIAKDQSAAVAVPSPSKSSSANISSPEFFNFLKSLATQALMSLGEIPNPMSGQAEIDLATAKEMIDLLEVLKLKTQGNCSSEEKHVFEAFLPELKLKYSQQA